MQLGNAPTTRRARPLPVQVWAAIGIGMLLLQAYTYAMWVARGQLVPTPTGTTPVPGGHAFLAHFFEASCGVLALLTLWRFVYRPWRSDGQLGTDGMLVLVCMNIYYWDPILNYHRAFILYTSEFVNLGSWTAAYPGASPPNAHLLPEPLIFMLSAFTWFFFGAAVLGSAVMRGAATRRPGLSPVTLVAIGCAAGITCDLIAETVFLRAGLYAYADLGPFTLFPSGGYRFPLAEALLVGLVCGALACVRYFRNDRGETVVERGASRLDGRVTATRLLALLGAGNAAFFVLYAIPINLAAFGAGTFDERVLETSYLTNGLCEAGDADPCGLRLPGR